MSEHRATTHITVQDIMPLLNASQHRALCIAVQRRFGPMLTDQELEYFGDPVIHNLSPPHLRALGKLGICDITRGDLQRKQAKLTPFGVCVALQCYEQHSTWITSVHERRNTLLRLQALLRRIGLAEACTAAIGTPKYVRAQRHPETLAHMQYKLEKILAQALAKGRDG